MSSITGFDFQSKVDVCGGNMWVWHRKMVGTDGLSLIKEGTELCDIPINWQYHLRVVKKQSHKTTLNLSGLTFESVTVSYWAESTASDTVRVPVQGQCSKSRVDPSESYAHDGDEHCGATDSSGFQSLDAGDVGLYHEHCWLPGRCTGFTLGDESVETMGDKAFLGSLWTRAGWIAEQPVAGIPTLRLYMRDGVSVEALCGSFADEVPGGFFPSRFEWFGRNLGKRVTWEDDGNEYQALVHGALYAAAYDFSADGGPVYAPDAGASSFALGIVAENVSGWTTGKTALLRGNPWRYATATNVYTYSTRDGSLGKVNTPVASESYIVAVDRGAVAEAELVARLRRIY
jgi:hypothetical protein